MTEIDRVTEYAANCNKDCYNCEYGVMRTPVDSYCCPVDIIYEMSHDIFMQQIKDAEDGR